jgi:hypothetical protein
MTAGVSGSMTKTKKQLAAEGVGKKPKRVDFKDWVKGLPFDERLTHARQSLKGVNNVAHFLNSLHETNQIVVYSDKLSKQVDRSYAANAYSTFVRGLQEIELVRLCSLWDKGERDAYSILTVIDLIDNDDVIDCISRMAGETRLYVHDENRDLGETKEDREFVRKLLVAGGERDARKERRKICLLTRRTIREAREIAASDMLKNVVNFRNKYIAHATGLTYAERDNGPLPLPKYGDETELLDRTLKIIERLDLCVQGISFMWQNSRDIEKRNAEYLWQGVTIKVLR